jgi:hypothetical protein
MKKYLFIAAVTAMLAAKSVFAGEFVGFSVQTVDGGAGYLGMQQACRNRFPNGTPVRICTTRDIMLSGRLSAQQGINRCVNIGTID